MKITVTHRLDDTYIEKAWTQAEMQEIEDLAAELLGNDGCDVGPLSRRGRSVDPDRQSDASRAPLKPMSVKQGAVQF